MKRCTRNTMVLLLSTMMIIGMLSACSNKDTDDTNKNANAGKEGTTNNNSGNQDITGTITMAGSTSMEKLANAVAESFMVKYPGVTVYAEFIGSSAGVEAVLARTVEIGNASRSLKDSEKSSGAVENIVAIDGIAIILDKNNTFTNITKEQLVLIYTGAINNWKAIGGPDLPIVVVGREAGSGTRGAFEELLEIVDQCKYSNEINSTGGVMAKVSSTPGAIGYVSLDVLDNTVISANIENIAPTEENIKLGHYALSRPFVMATVGQISEQNQLVQEFYKFIKSDEGKEIIRNVGLIAVD